MGVGFFSYFFKLCGLRLSVCRYDIPPRDTLFVSHPFLVVFCRFQVVDNEMVGWSGAVSSTEEKRRYPEVDSLKGEAFKRCNIGFGEPINEALGPRGLSCYTVQCPVCLYSYGRLLCLLGGFCILYKMNKTSGFSRLLSSEQIPSPGYKELV